MKTATIAAAGIAAAVAAGMIYFASRPTTTTRNNRVGMQNQQVYNRSVRTKIGW